MVNINGRPKGYRKGQPKLGRPRKTAKFMTCPDVNKTLVIDQILEKVYFGEIIKGQIVKRQLKDILAEYGVSRETYYYYINKHKVLHNKYMELKTTRRLITGDYAEDNIMAALKREGSFSDLESKEVAKLSLDVLKSIDKGYIPKLDVAQRSASVDLSMSMEDLQRKFEELSKS